jgi:hypothetical protein
MGVVVSVIRKSWFVQTAWSASEPELDPAVSPSPHDVRWTARHLQPRYRWVDSWLDIDLLLMQLGEPDLPYVIVEARQAARFAQAMGESDAMIVEVSSQVGMQHPTVWRLRRDVALPHAQLATLGWEGDGVDALTLFTAEEAGVVFRSWLRHGVLPAGASARPELVDY